METNLSIRLKFRIKDLLQRLFKDKPIVDFLKEFSGELLKHSNLRPLLDLAAEQPCNDAEQTTFADANYQLNSGIWLRDEIACFADDREVNLPRHRGKNWVAHHCVAPVHHLFWRDALLLRYEN